MSDDDGTTGKVIPFPGAKYEDGDKEEYQAVIACPNCNSVIFFRLLNSDSQCIVCRETFTEQRFMFPE